MGTVWNIEGLKFGEKRWVMDLAVKVYNAACDMMNNGLIERFNADSRWKEDYSQEEYEDAYERLWIKVAEKCAKKVGVHGKRIVKLTNGRSCVTFSPDFTTTYIRCKVEDYEKT